MIYSGCGAGVSVNLETGTGSGGDAEGDVLEDVATPDAEGRALLQRAAETFRLSARGYHRVMRVARTIADLDGSREVHKPHVAEAISFRVSLS